MLAILWLMDVSGLERVMSTKEKILDAALTLFAENGYDGTSVEQIATVVGIKAPSLYKHYKGKEDILNALIDSAEARYEEMFGSEKNINAFRISSLRDTEDVCKDHQRYDG